MSSKTLQCDYLLIGAGTSGMSFVDTLLSEDQDATVIIVDRKPRAGGHWVYAYDFVRLHQPSCNYGVNSLRLGKPEYRDTKGREKQNCNDRATAKDMVDYYGEVTKQFEKSGRVRFFFNTEYQPREDESNGKKHIIVTQGDGVSSETILVNCRKVVTNLIDVVPPSLRDGPTFPVHDSVTVKPVNDVPTELDKYKKFVVLGAGKTGVDALIYLLNNGIDKSNITWVRSRPVWYLIRDGLYIRNGRFPFTHKKTLFNHMLTGSTWQDVWRGIESDGFVGRVNPNDELPGVFKAPIIAQSELDILRSLKDQTIDLGRVKSITADSMVFQDGKTVPITSNDTIFVDCMAEDMYGYETIPSDLQIFGTDKITLGPFLIWLNPSFSASVVAFLEATISDDKVKNDMMFFPCGEACKATPENLLFGYYCQVKMLKSLQAHPEGVRFVLESRTNEDSPKHQGGLLKLLWAAFGPIQLQKKCDNYIERVDNGAFEGMKECMHACGNMDRPLIHKVPQGALKKTKKKKKSKQASKDACMEEESAVTAIMPYPSKSVSA